MKNYLLLLLFCLIPSLLLSETSLSPSKTIYLITPSRSLSTAFTRMMSQRGDFEVYSEPAQRAFMETYWPEINAVFDTSAASHYSEVKALLLQSHQGQNIFAKEMGYAVKDFLKEDPSVLQDSNVHVAFLVRKPHAVVLSRYFRNKDLVSNIEQLDKTRLETGFEGVLEVLKLAKQYSPNPITVILSEDLAENPEGIISSFCAKLEIPFIKDALQWADGGDNFQGSTVWHETKELDGMYYWHARAIKSTGFAKPREYDLDAQGAPTLSEVGDKADRERLRGVYVENLFFYEKFLKEIPEGALVSTGS